MPKLIKGKNDLATVNPCIASEWDFSSNSPLTPSDVFPCSHKKFMWICTKDPSHKFLAAISNRTSRGEGCPFCSGRKAIPGKTDLLTLNPFLASEWDFEANSPLTPDMVSIHSGKKVVWKCSFCKNSWSATIINRSHGTGCPKCHVSGTSFPENAIFHYIKPYFRDAIQHDKSFGYSADIYISSIKTVIEYDGSFYHSSDSSLETDNLKDELCHKNGVRIIRFRSSALPATQFAERIDCVDGDINSLARGISSLLDLLSIHNANEVDLKHDYYEIYSESRKISFDRSLQSSHPIIASEWDYNLNLPVHIEQVSSGSRYYAWWHCRKCGNRWQAYVYSRTAGRGCPVCGKSSRAKNVQE